MGCELRPWLVQLVPAAAERSIISIAAEIDAACQTPRSCVGSDGRCRGARVRVQVVAERRQGEQPRVRGGDGLVIEGLDLDGGATFVLALW